MATIFENLMQSTVDWVALREHCDRGFTGVAEDPSESDDFRMELLAARARIAATRQEAAGSISGTSYDRVFKRLAGCIAEELLRDWVQSLSPRIESAATTAIGPRKTESAASTPSRARRPVFA